MLLLLCDDDDSFTRTLSYFVYALSLPTSKHTYYIRRPVYHQSISTANVIQSDQKVKLNEKPMLQTSFHPTHNTNTLYLNSFIIK
mmetsp:Transcript_1377/g.2002  ORF Transcript_1377/g.2002 Transcript_1377/m.2002 type:complete len:85 (-) Transcript_1377:2706-2960(-)